MSNDDKPIKTGRARQRPGAFYNAGNRMLDDGTTVDHAVEVYMATYPDADPVAVRLDMEIEEAIGRWLQARQTDPEAPYQGPKIGLSEAEYILLLQATSGPTRVILRKPAWNAASASAAAEKLVRRDLAEFVAAERPELEWETRDGVVFALIATWKGMAAYDSQDHDEWAMVEQGFLRRPPQS